jgi:hypothetical protein
MLKGEINGRVVFTLEDKSNRAPFSRGNNQQKGKYLQYGVLGLSHKDEIAFFI